MLPFLLALICFVGTVPAQSFPTDLQSALDAGKLADAANIAKSANNPFALGITQSLEALQTLSQDLYRHGADNKVARTMSLPMLRVSVPENPNFEPLTYDVFRQSLADVIGQFDAAEKTLEAVNDPNVMLPLRLDTIRLDLTGDGKTRPAPLALIFGIASSTTDEPTTQAAEPFVLHLDAGDVYWLRGYCHLLGALGNMVLAYDEHELFDTTAHIFFENPKTPYAFLKHGETGSFDFPSIMDAIAFVHGIHLNVVEPQRLLAARDHFKATLQCSRDSWRAILAETDDDHEWIPNPHQTSPLPALSVTQERIDAWLKFLDEADGLFDGKTLIPFWRGNDPSMGVNLAKVFTDPKPFDLVLWVQGSGATPYLEKGPVTSKDVYENLARVFEGNVFTYAFWFN